ncbi:hypothetical protein EV421DRAFT_865172 [Armillaria borealis]|uniref:Uncharacterized protein n=1 Tax=Armillaria borealis TaxID=47425 RepID=A0AA39M4U0_9AGAR|nr:hypothetical protein EV421DRAFT_865172 [Armillaria borealis]
MHGQIKLVIIEMDTVPFKSTLHDQKVYTRLFTELYAASQYNKYIVNGYEPLDLRVYGLLSDTAENAFFSYDPATNKFEKDENVSVASNRKMVIHDMMRCMLFPPMSGILMTYLCASVGKEKIFSVLMHAYNEHLDGRYSEVKLLPKARKLSCYGRMIAHLSMQEDIPQMYTRVDAETTKLCDRTLPDLLAEAIKDAKFTTEMLEQHSNEDALKEGLHLLRKSLWVLPLAGATNYCWLGLHNDLDQMAMKAASNFRREQNCQEKRWKDKHHGSHP